MKILLEYWKLNFLSAIEYKMSFFIQVFAMILNDILFIAIWFLFFLKFWTIWWMAFHDFVFLMSIMVMVFALVHIFFWGYNTIWTMIEQWKIDNHLLLPKNLLVRLVSNRMVISTFWDFIFSLMLLYFVPNFSWMIVAKVILFSIFWAITFLWFLLIFVSLAFFIWSSRNLVKWIFEAVLWPSHYPPGIFEWTILKYVFMTILPIFYVIFLPYKLVINFDIMWFFVLICWSLFFLFLWVYTFYLWLRRYESGNMLNTNI